MNLEINQSLQKIREYTNKAMSEAKLGNRHTANFYLEKANEWSAIHCKLMLEGLDKMDAELSRLELRNEEQ